MQKMNFTFSASGWSAMADSPDMPSALMIHLGRDVEKGFELFSSYMIGVHKEWSRLAGVEGLGEKALAHARAQGMTGKALEQTAYDMSVHDMTEFTRLGEMLPEIGVRKDVEAGRLQRVLPDWAGSTVPVHALTATRLLPARTRAFIDFMKENAQNPD